MDFNVAPGQSRAAVVVFSDPASVQVKFGQHQTKGEFERAVDSLDKLDGLTLIDEALNVVATDVFSNARTDVRRVAVLLSDGRQERLGSNVDRNVRLAVERLRKLGVRVLALAMGHVLLRNTKILKLVTERSEDLVMAEDFDDLICKIPRIIACGK